jgi:hypothetical protein
LSLGDFALSTYCRVWISLHDSLPSLLTHLKCIYNFWCSMPVYTPFALCFVTLCGVFMHFPELTY